ARPGRQRGRRRRRPDHLDGRRAAAAPMSVAVPETPAPRSSPVARAALLAYLMLVVYASWFPFSGWHDSGLSPLAFLNLTFSKYWTGFDVTVNVIGYMPLGALLAFSMYPRLRGGWAILACTVLGVLVSGTMEAVQTYLPSRVASN